MLTVRTQARWGCAPATTMGDLLVDVYGPIGGIDYEWVQEPPGAIVIGRKDGREARRIVDLRDVREEYALCAAVTEACRSIHDELCPPPTDVAPGWEADGA